MRLKILSPLLGLGVLRRNLKGSWILTKPQGGFRV